MDWNNFVGSFDKLFNNVKNNIRFTMRRKLSFGKGVEVYDSNLDEWILKNSLNKLQQEAVNKLKLRR